ncbi:collagen-like triple helix repeat-containing protein [Burkholderia anthina]|uniref:collagen-like triple helix repeat-containing protein n=1 Tax=Burkholderia anthina TaxID=179879 RepID=UPI00158D2B80|nr:collagen-like triple helix repeat-containing protein [Burkholderia anthina]
MYRFRIFTPAALLAAAGVLTACGGSDLTAPTAGTGGTTVTDNKPPGPGVTDGGGFWTSGSPGTKGVISTAGQLAIDVGSTVGGVTLPGLGNAATRSAGDTISSVNTITRATADALSDGLGRIGTTADPVGTTLASLGNVVGATANPVTGLAQTVRALGTGPLAPLAPVTTPVGTVLDTVAGGLGAAGSMAGATLSSNAVWQVTQPLSAIVTPLVLSAGQATQQIGSATGLGQPVADLLGQVGGALSTAGWRAGTVAAQPAVGPASPFIGTAGGLVGALGNTVSNAAGLFNANGPNGVAPIPGLIVSVAGASVTTVKNGPSPGAGSNAGASGPLGGLLSGLGSAPLGSVTGAASPLAPVTSLVSTVTGTLGGVAGGAGSGAGAVANPLAPVTSLLGGVLGGVAK